MGRNVRVASLLPRPLELFATKLGPVLERILDRVAVRLLVFVGQVLLLVLLDQRDRKLAHSLDVLASGIISDFDGLDHGLNRLLLQLFVRDARSLEETVHDEVSLFLVRKAFSRLWKDSLKCLECDFSELVLLVLVIILLALVDVAEGRVEHRCQLCRLQSLANDLDEVAHEPECLNGCQLVLVALPVLSCVV